MALVAGSVAATMKSPPHIKISTYTQLVNMSSPFTIAFAEITGFARLFSPAVLSAHPLSSPGNPSGFP
jgi:hypothetical protein